MRRLSHAIVIVLAVGCAETASCPDGETRFVNPDGSRTECMPLDGLDAGPMVDAGETDGGQTPDAGVDAAPVDGCACAAPTPFCVAGGCAECVEGGDCDSDVCEGGVCLECDETHACPDDGLCTDDGECVACMDHGDCDAEAPICTDGVCGGCEGAAGDAACATRDAGTPACDDDTGECVACNARTETDACPGDVVCSSFTHTCTSTTRNTGLPCAPCEADSACMFGSCVPHTLDALVPGTGERTRYFCAQPPPVSGSCASLAPFSRSMDVESVDGEAGPFCMLTSLATCETYRDYIRPTGCTEASSCGRPGFEDALCRTYRTGMLRCTYRCESDDDCPDLSDCVMSGPRGYCMEPAT